MNVNFTCSLLEQVSIWLCECVLTFSDETTVFEHILLVKVKARTTNWNIYLRIEKVHMLQRQSQGSKKTYNRILCKAKMRRTERAFYPPLYLPKNMLAPVKPKLVLSQLRSDHFFKSSL